MKKYIKNNKNIIFVIILALSLIVPFSSVKAANPYSVVMVSNSTGNKTIGTYSNYNDAVKSMNSQNSTSTNVASIYKNGKIINSKYAIFQFKLKSSDYTVNLYQNASDSTAYTYTAPYYMTDGAFINSNEAKVQIMYNGFKGWVNIDEGNIIPISLLGASKSIIINAEGLRLRSSASTSASILTKITCSNAIFSYTDKTTSGGYTWYKITYNGKTGWVAADPSWLSETNINSLNTYYYRYSTGNLLHRYSRGYGVNYTDDYTNLGPTPSYLSENVRYYSFDGGIYLYNDILKMLDDYRNNIYSNSINSNNPNYPYYLYLPNRSVSKITAAQLNSQITNQSSKLYGQGQYFKEAESLYGMNALSAFATAKNESASGTSKIALNKNNVFGFGASDSCPYECARSYSSVRDSIMDYAKNGLSSYMTAENNYYFGTHAGTKGSGRNVKYASDPLWGEKQAWYAFMADKDVSLRDYKANTVAISKYDKYNLPVYKDTSGKTVIYYMRNKNSNFKVYNVPVTVIDKIGDYYKIYSDNSSYQYGYVKVSDFNINNTQPTINASDKTINLGSSFDYKNGVSASDKEDGNITNKISYEGSVNTNKAGEYKITYKVTDNSNFSTSKIVTVTVKGESEPVIKASDKEISQYTEFNYLDGVEATDDIDGDLSSEIIYEGEVDTSKIGEYEIIYQVTNSKGKTTSQKVRVKVIENSKPVIEVSDKTTSLGKSFNPLNGVKASDKEDGDITSKIEVSENTVDINTEGEYKVTYKVSDSVNQTITKTIKVNVREKKAEKADGLFYLDYLKEVNGKLQIKGYNTISGIDNDLNHDINYKIKFVNIDTLEEIYQEAERITNIADMPKSIYSFDGKNYTYSWFKLNVDLSSLPFGNYKMYVVSENDDYYSENIINNKLNKTMNSSFTLNDKTIVIRRNYSYEGSPVELIVRNNNYVKKTSDTYFNQFDKYTKFEFNEDNKLYLRGVSYSYGMDLSSSKIVKRQIIFENMETFETYTKELGSIINGNYKVVLPENDSFDKTRAWYDANVDISDIPKGNYIIYITTTSNVTDIYEMTEKMGRSLDAVKATISDKNYSFIINKKRGNRIEMIIK